MLRADVHRNKRVLDFVDAKPSIGFGYSLLHLSPKILTDEFVALSISTSLHQTGSRCSLSFFLLRSKRTRGMTCVGAPTYNPIIKQLGYAARRSPDISIEVRESASPQGGHHLSAYGRQLFRPAIVMCRGVVAIFTGRKGQSSRIRQSRAPYAFLKPAQ